MILDVVYNHTSEGGDGEADVRLAQLADGTYYLLDGEGRLRQLLEAARRIGVPCARWCGTPIIDSLPLVQVMHVDGFRFDLAAILSRTTRRALAREPAGAGRHRIRPRARRRKLIAEAWDAAGLYRVGHFVGENWKNGTAASATTMRAFVRGDEMVPVLADRLFGDPDTARARAGRRRASTSSPATTASRSTTSSSYDRKHNEASGETTATAATTT
ncbi:MAG: hypothetical protein U1F25_16770 [Rubrivivax sp.]